MDFAASYLNQPNFDYHNGHQGQRCCRMKSQPNCRVIKFYKNFIELSNSSKTRQKTVQINTIGAETTSFDVVHVPQSDHFEQV